MPKKISIPVVLWLIGICAIFLCGHLFTGKAAETYGFVSLYLFAGLTVTIAVPVFVEIRTKRDDRTETGTPAEKMPKHRKKIKKNNHIHTTTIIRRRN